MICTVSRAFTFDAPDRDLVDVSDETKIRIDADEQAVELRRDEDGDYPADESEIFLRGQAVFPAALRQWLGIFVSIEEPVDLDGDPVGTVRFRVSDGVTDRVWTGATWAPAGAGEWNTLGEIQTGIPSFPIATRSLRIVYNLATTDRAVTPRVRRAVVQFSAEVPSFSEELLLRTLIPKIRDNVRAEADLVVAWPGGVTFDLGGVELEEAIGAGVVDVGSAYDRDGDPDLATDLLASYVPGTETVTLTKDPGEGAAVLLRVIYKPIVAMLTHPDYDELGGLPAVILSSVTESFVREGPEVEGTVHVDTLVGLGTRAPRQVDYRVEIKIVAARLLDSTRLAEAVLSHFRRAPRLTIRAVDESAIAVVESDPTVAPRTDRTHSHMVTMVLVIKAVSKWIHDPEAGFGVGAVVTTVK